MPIDQGRNLIRPELMQQGSLLPASSAGIGWLFQPHRPQWAAHRETTPTVPGFPLDKEDQWQDEQLGGAPSAEPGPLKWARTDDEGSLLRRGTMPLPAAQHHAAKNLVRWQVVPWGLQSHLGSQPITHWPLGSAGGRGWPRWGLCRSSGLVVSPNPAETAAA